MLATSVLCREVLDGGELLPQLATALVRHPDSPRVIFWPSYIAAGDAEQRAQCEAYRRGAAALACGLGAWLLQANWPQGLNRTGACGFGGSVVIAPDGRRAQTLPCDEASLAVVAVARCSAAMPGPKPAAHGGCV